MIERGVRALGFVGGAGISLLMLVTVYDVTRRALVGSGVPGALEYSEILLVIVVFLGFGLAQQTGAHIRTSLVTSRLRPAVSRWVRITGMAPCLLVAIWMAYGTAERAWASYVSGEYRFGLAEVAMWPGRAAVAVGLATLVLQMSLQFLREVRAVNAPIDRGEEAVL